MPISKFLAEKWEARLYNWLLWKGPDGKGSQDKSEGVSSAYSLEEFGQGHRGGYSESGKAVLSGEAMDTDALMLKVRLDRAFGERIYKALVVWAINDGTRGAQAGRLSTQLDTFKDWVDSGIRQLERLSRAKTTREIKTPRLSPERVYD